MPELPSAESPPLNFRHLSAIRAGVVLFVITVISIVCQWPAWTETPLYASANLAASLGIATTGLLLIGYQNLKPLGYASIGCGVVWSVQWLSLQNGSIGPFIGLHANMAFFVLGGVGLLLTPFDRRLSKFDRRLIVAFIATFIGQDATALFSRPEWSGYSSNVWWPTVYDNHELWQVLQVILYSCYVGLAVGFTYAGYVRIRTMKRLDRDLALPVVSSYCIVGMVAGFTAIFEMVPPPKQSTLYFLVSLSILGVPFSLAIAALRRTIRRAFLTEQLSRRLASRLLTGDSIRDEFRSLLGDSTLEIFYWSTQAGEYVDSDGRSIPLERVTASGFSTVLEDRNGTPMAAIVGDATLVDHIAMLDSFLAACTLAIENVQLQASVKAQLAQVRASRARIVEATLEERRRIERDLHDGVQQRLLAIHARVGAYRKANNTGAEEMLNELSNELQSALNSLRELARGIHPTELRQFGLRGALEVVAERLPINVKIEIEDYRYPVTIESTFYFVACEALTNAVKHSGATEVTIRIDRIGDELTLSVSDNGNGGAAVRTGGGLEGLVDRMRTMGGELGVSVNSSSGSEISAWVEIPPPGKEKPDVLTLPDPPELEA